MLKKARRVLSSKTKGERQKKMTGKSDEEKVKDRIQKIRNRQGEKGFPRQSPGGVGVCHGMGRDYKTFKGKTGRSKGGKLQSRKGAKN